MLRLQFSADFLNIIFLASWIKLGNILDMFNISTENYFFNFWHQKEIIIFLECFCRISPILHGRSPRLSELFSKLEWYFCSRFFCATRYRPVVYEKKCLGRRGARSAPAIEQTHFSLRIFPNPRSTYLESVNAGKCLVAIQTMRCGWGNNHSPSAQ